MKKKRSMKGKIAGIFVSTLLIATSLVLMVNQGAADWDEELDDHKMAPPGPQLPDPNGWDVNATYPWNVLADDWMCNETGPVTDIHLWGSWKRGQNSTIEGFYIGIWSNNPGDPGGGVPSYPETLLWSDYITDFTERMYGTGVQSWYDPETGELITADHFNYYQYNIINISDPLWQEEGTIYWLSVSANVTQNTTAPPCYWGWKTSILFNTFDDAFWGYYFNDVIFWVHELYKDPPSISMDLAFVITGPPCCNKDWDYWSNPPNMHSLPSGAIGMGTTSFEPGYKVTIQGSSTLPKGLHVRTADNTYQAIVGQCHHQYRPAGFVLENRYPASAAFPKGVMMRFKGMDTNGVMQEYLAFVAEYVTRTAGAIDGDCWIRPVKNNAANWAFRFTHDGKLLIKDGGAATDVPESALHVVGAINLDPIPAPAAPTTGFIIYCDQADGDLKAKSDTGIVTLIASD